MYIGEISKLAGASPKAIRHYESLGLLGTVTRAGKYRVYSDDAVRQVKLIRQAQSMGFRLSELGSVLNRHATEPDWPNLVKQIDLKRLSIQDEIRNLRGLDVQLRQINEEIRSCLAADSIDASAAQSCDAWSMRRRDGELKLVLTLPLGADLS